MPATLLAGCLAVWTCQAGEPTLGLPIGGCGGVWLLPDQGELTIEIEKRDRNRSGAPTDLRAILFGPDRQVVAEHYLPFAGQAKGSGLGPAQRCKFSVQVDQPGVYGLCVTISNDRYGDTTQWSFATNCKKYLLETSRGHRDRRHEEPILLLDREQSSDVCFRPRAGEFAVEVSGYTKQEDLPLFDAEGQTVATLSVAKDGKAQTTIPADPQRGAGPWRLHLPTAWATIQIDGLTRWDNQDLLRDQCVWTPDLSSWFDWSSNRWLVFPYRQRRFGQAGETGTVSFELHNNALQARNYEVALEYPNAKWQVTPSTVDVSVPARRSSSVELRYTVPAEPREVRVRVTADDGGGFSTWASLRVEPGEPPANRPLELPLQLQPFTTANTVYGYTPDYPVDNQLYYDSAGRGFVAGNTYLWSQAEPGGKWRKVDLLEAVVDRVPAWDGPIGGLISTKVAFDADDDVYLLATAGARKMLLHSMDQGLTFTAYTIPGNENRGRGFDFEQFSGHNIPSGPPPICRNTAVPTPPDPKHFWRRVNELDLFVPKKVNGKVEFGQPIPISKQSLGLSGHSGMPSSVVSREGKVHVVYGEATDPDEKVPGVPTYVNTYEVASGQLGQPQMVGYGAPANDIHNTPSITMDSRGYLHVLTGTHGAPFGYSKSLAPHDSQQGFTKPEQTGDNLRQTYIGFVCGPDDTLHLAFRLNRSRVDVSPVSYHTALVYQRKRPGEDWSAPQLMVLPMFSEYSIYYHRLTIDHHGRLLLSYDYWSTFWFQRNDQLHRPRAVLTSNDSGSTWGLWEG